MLLVRSLLVLIVASLLTSCFGVSSPVRIPYGHAYQPPTDEFQPISTDSVEDWNVVLSYQDLTGYQIHRPEDRNNPIGSFKVTANPKGRTIYGMFGLQLGFGTYQFNDRLIRPGGNSNYQSLGLSLGFGFRPIPLNDYIHCAPLNIYSRLNTEFGGYSTRLSELDGQLLASDTVLENNSVTAILTTTLFTELEYKLGGEWVAYTRVGYTRMPKMIRKDIDGKSDVNYHDQFFLTGAIQFRHFGVFGTYVLSSNDMAEHHPSFGCYYRF